MEKKEKKRLDELLVERGLVESLEKALPLIMAGEVVVGEARVEKPGTKFPVDVQLRLKNSGSDYASRGGHKLAGALEDFEVDPTGLDVLDVGASTGGFTDCLLKNGAASVCALDAGYGQIAGSLRNDPRVTVMDRIDARNIVPEDFKMKFDLATIDVSFISLLKIIPAVKPLVKDGGLILALVKPQFEVEPGGLEKGGVVRKAVKHIEVLETVIRGVAEMGMFPRAVAHSKLPGPKGNIEFFLYIKTGENAGHELNISEIVHKAHKSLIK